MASRLPLSLFCVTLACASLPAGARAAELGDARVGSHIGQQLVAEIELTALHDDATPVQARLASADIYRGAGIVMPPVLSGLNLSVVRRGARQFLNLTSTGAVQSEYLHLYLELADGNERSVRLATLWFTPDPNPAPKPAPEARPAPKLVPAPELESPTKAGLAPGQMSAPKPEPAYARKTSPELKTELKASTASAAGLALAAGAKPGSKPASAVPVASAVSDAPKSKAALIHAPAAKVAPAAAPAPTPLPAAAPASCPRPDPAVLKTCVALDYKNAQLNAQLGQLEDKVKVLQIAMGAAPPSVGAPAPTPRAAKETARVMPRVATLKKKAPAPPEPEFPWWWLALGGTVLTAVVAVFVLRRKAAREREAKARKAALPPVMPAVKNRLMPDKGAPDQAVDFAERTQE